MKMMMKMMKMMMKMMMDGLLSTLFFIVLFYFKESLGQLYNTPKISGPLELQLNAGDTLTVQCSGEAKLIWTYPVYIAYQNPPIEGRITIVETVQDGRYETTLTLSALQYADTGEFLCIYANTSRTQFTSVVLYVYVQDNQHLFAAYLNEMNVLVLAAVSENPLTIPCRSTNPNITVTLRKGSTVQNASNVLSYDPRKGFLISYITTFYSGKFTCHANAPDGRTDSKTFDLIFMPSNKPKQPSITAIHRNVRNGESNETIVLLNDTLFLRCVVECSSCQSLVLYWSVEATSRINITDARRVVGNDKLVETNLTIFDVQFWDAQTYTCEARESTNQKTNSKEINVLVTDLPRFHLEESSELVKVFPGVPNVSLYVTIVTQSNLKLKWYKGKDVISTDNRHFQQQHQLGHSILKVLEPKVEDSGFYSLFGENDYMIKKNVSIELNVFDVDVDFEAPKEVIVTIGDIVTVECKANERAFTQPRFYKLENNGEMLLQNDSDHLLINAKNDKNFLISSLIINNISEDETVVRCRTKSIDEKDHFRDSEIIAMPVQSPKFLKSSSGRTIISPGSSHGMDCLAEGAPAPVYVWYKDGSPLDRDSSSELGYSFNHNKSRLDIINANESHSGNYSCEASNRGGIVFINMTVIVSIDSFFPSGLSSGYIALIVLPLIILIIGIIALIIFRKKCRKTKYIAVPYEAYLKANPNERYDPELPLNDQTDSLAYDESWEFPKECLKFDIILGQGAFGKVMRAQAVGMTESDEETPVAVKMVRDIGDREQLKALLSELKILIHLGSHLNIVNLLGAVTTELNKGALYVIVEYCSLGCIRNHLIANRSNFLDTMDDEVKLEFMRKKNEIKKLEENEEHALLNNYINSIPPSFSSSSKPSSSSIKKDGKKNDEPLITKDLICFAFQIARGMDYLSSKKYIHRDLATRNVLLAEDKVVKICDFGLAKDCYKYNEYHKKSDTPIPVKWMAVESLTHKLYTTKSDVWSFGILVWELFTLGGNPYPGVEIDESFIDRLKKGYRMEKPPNCSEKVFKSVLECWDAEPDERPHFSKLVDQFGDFLESSVRQHYLDLNSLQKTPERVGGGGGQYLLMKKAEESTKNAEDESSYLAPKTFMTDEYDDQKIIDKKDENKDAERYIALGNIHSHGNDSHGDTSPGYNNGETLESKQKEGKDYENESLLGANKTDSLGVGRKVENQYHSKSSPPMRKNVIEDNYV